VGAAGSGPALEKPRNGAPSPHAVTRHSRCSSDLEANRGLILPIRDAATDELAFEQLLQPPIAAGLHAVGLADRGVSLEPHRQYRFVASQIRDEARRDLDVTSGFDLELRPGSAPESSRPGERPQDLAAAGSWIDAFAALPRRIEAEPVADRARAAA